MPASLSPDAPLCQDVSLPVPVRFSNTTTLRDRDLRAIAAMVDAIWAPYGVRFNWEAAPGSVEIFFDAEAVPPIPGSTPLPLASIAFVDGKVTPRISVSYGNARLLAARARTNDRPFVTLPPPLQAELIDRMLGVAVAHELGHYLLNAKSHSVVGLLRPNIPTSQLMEANLRHLRLNRDQSSMLCQSVRRAAGAAPSADGMQTPAVGTPLRPGGQ